MNTKEILLMLFCAILGVSADYEPQRHTFQCPGGKGYCATTRVCCSTDDRCAEYHSYNDDGCVEQWTVARIWYTFVIIAFLVLICVAITIYCRRRRQHVIVTTTTTAAPHMSPHYPPVIAPNGTTLYPTFLPDGRPVYPIDTNTGLPILPQGVMAGPDGQPMWPPVATGVPVAVVPPPLSVPPQAQGVPQPVFVVQQQQSAPSAPPMSVGACEPGPLPPQQQQQQQQQSEQPQPV